MLQPLCEQPRKNNIYADKTHDVCAVRVGTDEANGAYSEGLDLAARVEQLHGVLLGHGGSEGTGSELLTRNGVLFQNLEKAGLIIWLHSEELLKVLLN